MEWLQIRSSWGSFRVYGHADGMPATMLYGSSIAYSGINWNTVAARIGAPIGRWPTPGSTPSEWEQFQRWSGSVRRSFVAVSAVDLNEYALCDFRAEIVPLWQTVRDLSRLPSDRAYAKKVLEQYPVRTLRLAFPTIGRSDGVLTGTRDRLRRLLHGRAADQDKEAFVMDPNQDAVLDERVTDWDPGRRERRMVLARAACNGRQGFAGLKRAALERILATASRQGPTVAVVLPMSPYYRVEFFGPAVTQEFEKALNALQADTPDVRWLRLDRLSVLDDNRMFVDFVHMNRTGQEHATRAFLAELESEVPGR